MVHALRNFLAVAVMVVTLSACAAREETHGFIPDADKLAEIELGVHKREQVANILGTPPGQRLMNPDRSSVWYYIMRRTRVESFFDEEVVDQRVLAIEFDPDGVVQGMRNYTLADARQIDPSDRETPTRGKRANVLEQFLGSISPVPIQ